MKTIEERAKEYASKKADISLSAIYNEALASIYFDCVDLMNLRTISRYDALGKTARISFINHYQKNRNEKDRYQDHQQLRVCSPGVQDRAVCRM